MNTLRDWEKLEAQTGSLENRPLKRKHIKLTVQNLRNGFKTICTARAKKRQSSFIAVFPGFVAQRKLWELRAKNTVEYTERDEQKRQEFFAQIDALPEDSDSYYVDESGFDEYYTREYGYAPRGKKVIGKISGRHFARTSVVTAMVETLAMASRSPWRTSIPSP